MLFVCDIGNSRIKGGTFSKDKLTSFKFFKDADAAIKFGLSKKITRAAVSSVVPEKLKSFKKIFYNNFNFSPAVINKNPKFNLKVDYNTPRTLGIDRLCSAEGAFYLFNLQNTHSSYGKNTVILTIDFGTATTINVIKYNRTFTGGLIMPGIQMMFNSLANETAQLPLVKSSDYINIIGSSTRSSIASGVVNSTLGGINRVIVHIKQLNNKSEIIIYITGGNAESILPYLNFNYNYEEGLVLYGIKAVYENTIKKV